MPGQHGPITEQIFSCNTGKYLEVKNRVIFEEKSPGPASYSDQMSLAETGGRCPPIMVNRRAI